MGCDRVLILVMGKKAAQAHMFIVELSFWKRRAGANMNSSGSFFWYKKEEGGSCRRQEARRASGGIYTSLMFGPEHDVPRLAVEYPASGSSLSAHHTGPFVF